MFFVQFFCVFLPPLLNIFCFRQFYTIFCPLLCSSLLKCSLGISNFLEEISSLSHSIVFLYFFTLITEEGFLISPCYSLELFSNNMYTVGQQEDSIHYGHSVTQPDETATITNISHHCAKGKSVLKFLWLAIKYLDKKRHVLPQLTTLWLKSVTWHYPLREHLEVYSYYTSQIQKAGSQHEQCL